MFDNISENLRKHLAIAREDEPISICLSNQQARKLLEFLNDCQKLTCEVCINNNDSFIKYTSFPDFEKFIKSELCSKMANGMANETDIIKWEKKYDWEKNITKFRGTIVVAGGRHSE